jgi:hypothetical protein
MPTLSEEVFYIRLAAILDDAIASFYGPEARDEAAKEASVVRGMKREAQQQLWQAAEQGLATVGIPLGLAALGTAVGVTGYQALRNWLQRKQHPEQAKTIGVPQALQNTDPWGLGSLNRYSESALPYNSQYQTDDLLQRDDLVNPYDPALMNKMMIAREFGLEENGVPDSYGIPWGDTSLQPARTTDWPLSIPPPRNGVPDPVGYQSNPWDDFDNSVQGNPMLGYRGGAARPKLRRLAGEETPRKLRRLSH